MEPGNRPFFPDDWFVPGQSPGRTAPWSPGTDHFFPDDWFVPGQSPGRTAPWSPGADHFFPDDWFVPGQSPDRIAPWSPGTDHFFPDDWIYPDNRNAPTPAAGPSSAPPAPSPRPNPFHYGFANPSTPPLHPFAAYWDTIPASRVGAVAWAPPIFPDAFGRFLLTPPAPAPLAVPLVEAPRGLFDSLAAFAPRDDRSDIGTGGLLGASAGLAASDVPSIDAAQRLSAPKPWAQSVLGFGPAPFSGSPFETGSGLGDQFSWRSLPEDLAGPPPAPPSQSNAGGILPPSLDTMPPAPNAAGSFADGGSSPPGTALVGSESNPFSKFLNALNPISPAFAADDEGWGWPPVIAQAVAQGLIDAATAKRLTERAKVLQDSLDAWEDLRDIIQGRPSPRALGRALEASGVSRPPGYDAHHIVAGGDKRAAGARDILKSFKIGINDASNGVFLPADKTTQVINDEAIHASLHTKEYFERVEEALKQATSREDALRILRRIGQALQSGNFP
jgi:hypothetical protein